MTASGQGDGTTAPAPDTSHPFNADGLIRQDLEWDDNSLLSDGRGSINDRSRGAGRGSRAGMNSRSRGRESPSM